MPTEVRNLRVIRLDDLAVGPVSADEYFPEDGDGVVFDPLELVTFSMGDRIGLAINSLDAARVFWEQFTPSMVPDLVLSDVNFEHDNQSPLQDWGPGATRPIPTGLMHAKPFLAIARAAGKPISIGLHSANLDSTWRFLLEDESPQHAWKRVYGLLAAHEAIEVAAIVGDRLGQVRRDALEPVWQWFRDHMQSSPRAALELALCEYRRQLTLSLRMDANASGTRRLRIGVRDWPALVDWCKGMAENPLPLRRDADVGLPLLYPDGTVDRISFASIFADVRFINTQSLPSSCFELVRVEDPWKLKDGLPQIGAVVAECGEMGLAAKTARSALARLPVSTKVPQSNLRDVLKEDNHPALALGLAVLFRALEFYRNDDSRWSRLWIEGPWDPCALDELDEDSDWPLTERRSVAEWIGLSAKALQKAEASGAALCDDGFVTVDDIKDELEQLWPRFLKRELTVASLNRHLDFLCDLKCVESRVTPAGTVYRTITTVKYSPNNSRPSRPAKGTTGLTWEADALAVMLRNSLGFGPRDGSAVNDNAIGQILYDAFVRGANDSSATPNKRGIEGRAFLEKFLKGGAPGWLKEICRCYCIDVLRWGEGPHWPYCIR